MAFFVEVVDSNDKHLKFDECGGTTVDAGNRLLILNKDRNSYRAVFNRDEWKRIYEEEDLNLFEFQHPTEQVAKFMEEGGQTVPLTTDYTVANEFGDYAQRVQDEVDELTEAMKDQDVPEMLDALIDTAYVALSGAVRLVGKQKAHAAWNAVSKANWRKVNGDLGPVVRDEETGKILKPEGWWAPDIESIVAR